jgi:hypothetical protein
MAVGDFTASNIAMEEDRKKSVIDMDKLRVDIAAAKALAQQVGPRREEAGECR